MTHHSPESQEDLRFRFPRLQRIFFRNNLVLFLLLFGLWLLMSGHYDVFHISMGFLCSLLVVFINLRVNKHFFIKENVPPIFPIRLGRLLFYIPWLVRQIVIASLQVASVVLSPKMPVNPSLVKFRTKLPNMAARVILANSITLTPGTITLELNDDEYLVHSLLDVSLSGIIDGSLPGEVAKLYHEKPGQVVICYDIHKSLEKL